MIVEVNPDECVGCETCVPECPVDAIAMVDDKAIIDQDKCTQCQSCVEVCPVEAISAKE